MFEVKVPWNVKSWAPMGKDGIWGRLAMGKDIGVVVAPRTWDSLWSFSLLKEALPLIWVFLSMVISLAKRLPFTIVSF